MPRKQTVPTTIPKKRFFTKETFFNQLQTSMGNQKPNLGDRLKQAILKRKPRRI